jgi:hypothetical protein
MAKSIKKIIESVREELGQYKLSDDFPIEDEYLLDKANDCRASLIRDVFKSGVIDDNFYQEECCLEVNCVDAGCTINGTFIPSGNVLWYVDLPALVTDVAWYDVKYFGTVGFTNDFSRKNFFGWLHPEGNIWTANKPMFTIIGNRAYIKNLPTPGLRYLCMIGLFYNPTDICDYDLETDEYPVPSDITLQLLMKKDILSTWQTPIPDPHQDGKYPDITDAGQQPQKKR